MNSANDTLPSMRLFVVRRANPVGNPDFTQSLEEIYVSAHFVEYGQGGVLVLMAFVIDELTGEAMTRTVRAFNSWLDVEVVAMPVNSELAH